MTDTQTTNQNKGADLAGFAAMFEAIDSYSGQKPVWSI